jgi:hypothetical protein
MRRILVVALALTALLACPIPGRTQDDLQTTTEYGITVTPEQISDAILETQDFWGPVRRHVQSDEFGAADQATRARTVAFYKRVHDSLHNRLWEQGEAPARDLIFYLTQRIRKFDMYRQLRVAIDRDAEFAKLVDRWERTQRDLHHLPEGERAARGEAVLKTMREEMIALGLPPERTEEAMRLWTRQADCIRQMANTEAGKMLLGYDREARQSDPATSELIRAVGAAADWAWITRAPNQLTKKSDFLRSWDELAKLGGQSRTAAAAPSSNSR